VRILLDYRPALRHRTGVGEYAHELARALVATSPGASEELVLFSSSWKDRLDRAAVPGAATIDSHWPNQVLNFCWHRLGWPPAERFGGRPLDVVQAFHPMLIPARDAAQVVTVHDFDFLDHPERTVREVRRDYAALAPDHIRRADHVIAISQATSREVQRRFGVEASRITVCTPGAPSWTPRLPTPDRTCILFLGTIEPRKNLGVLLDAYERVLASRPHAPQLVLAGRATDAAADVIRRTSQAPLAGHVDLLGYIEPGVRDELYRRALIFVMPSHTEGFGIPVLEAMTMGVPVIVANSGALPEVAGQAGLMFEPDDSEQLAAHLTAVLDSRERWQSMRDAGLEQARQFDWRESARRLRQAWMAAIETRRRRRG
jgi:glycosyltransferase involved in cell wall biosynthesis